MIKGKNYQVESSEGPGNEWRCVMSQTGLAPSLMVDVQEEHVVEERPLSDDEMSSAAKEAMESLEWAIKSCYMLYNVPV